MNIATPASAESNRRRPVRREVRALGWTALGAALVAVTLWAVAALFFDVRVSWLQVPLTVSYYRVCVLSV